MSDTRPLPIATRTTLYLRDNGPATVSDIAQALQVSRTSIENVLGVLTDSKTVIRTTANGAGVGRPSRSYEFNAEQGYVAGVDIGNASIRVVISDLGGCVLSHHVGDGVGAFPDGASKLDAVTSVIRRAFLSASIPLERLRALGFSLPGIINESGFVLTSVVIPEWSGVDIAEHLRQVFQVGVAIDNGVRLAAVAERHLGAAQLVDDVLYLSVGNRVAMGLILDGKSRRGVHDVAGDIGRLIFPGERTETGQISWANGENAADVFARARDGNSAASDEIAAFVDRLGRALSTFIMAVDPAKVVVGGGLSQAHEELLVPLGESVAQYLKMPFEIPIVEACLGDKAAAHGALVLAFQKQSLEIYGLKGMAVPRISDLHPVPSHSSDVVGTR